MEWLFLFGLVIGSVGGYLFGTALAGIDSELDRMDEILDRSGH